LLFGRALTTFIISSFSTETVRMPLVINPATYSIAIIVVLSAACGSFVVVSRLIKNLDMVGVLKARE
ncbi:MAG TPA: hypothetical protein VK956_15680, partial [Verrucomicrobium sp.]|nr:hypothetical protein [Verrucomicrobium sp.]